MYFSILDLEEFKADVKVETAFLSHAGVFYVTGQNSIATQHQYPKSTPLVVMIHGIKYEI